MFSEPDRHVDLIMNSRTPHLDDWVAETPESMAARLEGAKAVVSTVGG
jgi:hypothetical protein